MNDMWRFASILIPLAALAGCAGHAPVPVAVSGPAVSIEPAVVKPAAAVEAKAGYYIVKKGDTLYRIALEHGQDYKDVAAWNNVDNPGRIEVGQQLRVVPPAASEATAVAVVKPVAGPAPVEAKPLAGAVVPASGGEGVKREPRGGKLPYSDQALAQAAALEGGAVAAKPAAPSTVEKAAVPPPQPVAATVAAEDAVDWAWPVPGKVLVPFAEGVAGKESSKGIDLAGKVGEPVLAAAAGVVTYVGAGLRGYGNLVVLKHNAEFLSVYAHNSKILVKEKESVTKGQKVAEIGNSDADQPKLHFEIRRQGKPVDPLKYLPTR